MKPPKISLTWKIMIGLVLGIFIGWLVRELDSQSANHTILGFETATILAFIRSLSTLFLNLVKSIIAPLIFATLVIGIAGTHDIKQVGRMGIKALVYFEIVTTLALFIGLAAVNIVRPGDGVSLSGISKAEDKAVLADRAKAFSKEATDAAKKAGELRTQAKASNDPAIAAQAEGQAQEQSALATQKAADAADAAAKGLTAADPPAKPQTFGEIIAHLSPTSIFKAMAEGDVLQIVVFSVLFALAVVSIGKKADAVVVWCESLADIMFRFTEFVMKFAPIGVGAAMAYTIGHNEQGLKVLWNLGLLVLTLYGALAAFFLLVLTPIIIVFRVPIKDFINAVKAPASLAFATTSSEAALPKAMENMMRIGVPRRIVGFVLPTGYSFNLDGTTLYLSLASIFVAQAAGVSLTWTQQIVMLLTLMLTSKGVAAVPRASLVVLLATLASFNLPVEGVVLILGIDELMDMARTATNVIGNCLATIVIAKWEGAFRNEEWEREEADLKAVTGLDPIVSPA
jgi:proton glutamate symport protein